MPPKSQCARLRSSSTTWVRTPKRMPSGRHERWLWTSSTSLMALPCSASRVAGEISAAGRSRIRPFGLTAALHPAPGLPVSRARRSQAAPPDCASVCFGRGQNDPAAPSVSRVRSRRLPARVGQTYRQTHTHERGSISSGWPPNQPASRIAKLFGEGREGGVVGPVFGVGLAARMRLENFCARKAGGCAVPDPDRFGETRTFGYAPTLTWWRLKHLEISTCLTIKPPPTRPSNFTG